jgi:2-polyprenyl-6-methoxyphenol hydroxylase-like FAD-dependent oxidoreductase
MPKVAVVGGSIGGLCAGIALRGIGCDVEIYERAQGPMTSRGAGIVTRPPLLRLLRDGGAPELPTTSCLYRHLLLPDGGDGLRGGDGEGRRRRDRIGRGAHGPAE